MKLKKGKVTRANMVTQENERTNERERKKLGVFEHRKEDKLFRLPRCLVRV